MGDVIDLASFGDFGNRKILDYFRTTYKKAGLSDQEIDIAMKELEPIVREFMPRKEFKLTLSDDLGFNKIQIQAITDAHNKCMQGAIKYFREQLWLALCKIAGLIGRSAQST